MKKEKITDIINKKIEEYILKYRRNPTTIITSFREEKIMIAQIISAFKSEPGISDVLIDRLTIKRKFHSLDLNIILTEKPNTIEVY